MINLDFHSPEEEIHHPLLQQKKIRLYLKRDDLIHPFISGNKWRKLKYILRKAEASKKSHLVTFGGVWSNHLLATACAAAKFGFVSTGIVRGEDIATEVLTLCKLFGMRLIFVDRDSYRDKLKLFNSRFEPHDAAFFIDEGGYSEEAAKGCSELVDELQQNYQHIFCAAGTGATSAGIINGINRQGAPTEFHAVPVLKGEFIKHEIEKLVLTPSNHKIHYDYHFGGYAKTQPELIQFISDFASYTGILLDPVYTGKMMYTIFDLARKNYFENNSKILAVHTGGLLGILGMKDKFG